MTSQVVQKSARVFQGQMGETRQRPLLPKEKLFCEKGAPPSRVNFIDCLNEKNVDPFAGAKDSL